MFIPALEAYRCVYKKVNVHAHRLNANQKVDKTSGILWICAGLIYGR
jgi:hypothetical protein